MLTPRLLAWPRVLNALLIGAGLAAIMWGAPRWVPSADTGAVTTITRHGTRLVTSTLTVTRKVHGRVVTHDENVYVVVPVVVVHTDHHTIKVPKHLLPLKSAAATIANPLVTVTAYVPTTIVEPVTVTSTVTTTDTELVPTTVTTTITLPLTTGGPET